MGGFLVSVFEVIGIGLGHNVDAWNETPEDLNGILENAKSIWGNTEFTKNQGSGVPGRYRIRHTLPLGRNLFQR
jgi:hypothetical protein